MKAQLERLREFAIGAAKQAKLRKRLTLALAVIIVLQLYFVRELIAAELLFGLGFLFLLFLAGVFYLIGYLGEQSYSWFEAGIRAFAPVARRGYVRLEEISKKPFRHPRSESVP